MPGSVPSRQCDKSDTDYESALENAGAAPAGLILTSGGGLQTRGAMQGLSYFHINPALISLSLKWFWRRNGLQQPFTSNGCHLLQQFVVTVSHGEVCAGGLHGAYLSDTRHCICKAVLLEECHQHPKAQPWRCPVDPEASHSCRYTQVLTRCAMRFGSTAKVLLKYY